MSTTSLLTTDRDRFAMAGSEIVGPFRNCKT